MHPTKDWTIRTPPQSADGPTAINRALVDDRGYAYVLDGTVADLWGDGTWCDDCGGWLRKIDRSTGSQLWAVALDMDRVSEMTMT